MGINPFRFENMWLREEGFKHNLKGWWTGYNFKGSYCCVLAAKMKALKFDLQTWNEEF